MVSFTTASSTRYGIESVSQEDGTHLSDTDIATRSMLELRTVISKDSDFFCSLSDQKKPHNLL